jgi:SulP family sulfate permease
MSEFDRFRTLLSIDTGERALLLLTFTLTILVDLTVAIGVGVTLASLMFMARMSETTGVMSSEESVDDPAQRAALPRGVEVFRFTGPMFFGVAGEMLDVLHRSGSTPKTIVVRMDLVPYVDSSGARTLEVFVRQAAAKGTRVILCDLRSQPAAFLHKAWSRFSGAERVATFSEALSKVAAVGTK